MRRLTWLIVAVAPVLVAACADPLHMAGGHSPRLAHLSGDEVLQSDMTPSKGDVVGFGGSMLGQLAAGVPGGALLGFGGQMTGGNSVGKAVGSTLGTLAGSILGPLGSMLGGLLGGYAGDQLHAGPATELAGAEPGGRYIDDLDLGPRREKAS